MIRISPITQIDNQKHIAILDTSSISFMQKLQEKGVRIGNILCDYELILIPGWVLIEIEDAEGRAEFVQDLIDKGYKSFGSGEITSVIGNKLRVIFEAGDIKVFKFPQALIAYLEIDDVSLMPAILEVERQRKMKEDFRRKKEEEERELRAKQEAEKSQTRPSAERFGWNRGTYRVISGDREEPRMYREGIIGPGTSFATHADALNSCFRFHYKQYQKAYKKVGNGYAVWFPNIARKIGDQFVSSDEYWGWLNVLSDSGDTMTEFENPDYTGSSAPDKNRRIIFAHFNNDRGYRFIGVYAYSKRVEKGYAYTRIATMFDTKRMRIIDSEGTTV